MLVKELFEAESKDAYFFGKGSKDRFLAHAQKHFGEVKAGKYDSKKMLTPYYDKDGAEIGHHSIDGEGDHTYRTYKKPVLKESEDYSTKLAKRLPKGLKSEKDILDKGFDIAKAELGAKKAGFLFGHDEDFPSDLVTDYNHLQKSAVKEGAFGDSTKAYEQGKMDALDGKPKNSPWPKEFPTDLLYKSYMMGYKDYAPKKPKPTVNVK